MNRKPQHNAFVRKKITACRGLVKTVTRFLLLTIAISLISVSVIAFDEAPDPVITLSQPSVLWLFLPLGYLFSIAIETPVLLIGLSRDFSFKQRLFAGIWLTACTYPVVVLVLPFLFASSPRWLYLLVAEVFAPIAECALFWLAFRNVTVSGKSMSRNFAVIVLANLMSFGGGELLNRVRWFGLF